MSKSNRSKRRQSKPLASMGLVKVRSSNMGGLGARRASTGGATAELEYPTRSQWLNRLLPGFVLLAIAVVYAYWPTLQWIEDAWRNEPDYSHGYLVVPLAGMLLWSRRDVMPGLRNRASILGLSLIVLAIAMRLLSRLLYADFLDGWSLVVLVGGVVWFLFGFRFLWWSLPAVVFLLFMVPLPFQAESLLSWKLQGIATEVSTVMLRVLGQPAVSEAHVVWVNDQQLMIEEACSGLRIFIGVAALAFFWAAMATRSWIDRIVLVAVAVPLAVFVNAARITFVGIAYQFSDDAQTRNLIHDISGYIMIPVAFTLLWLIKLLWEHLYRPVERLTAKDFIPPVTAAASAV